MNLRLIKRLNKLLSEIEDDGESGILDVNFYNEYCSFELATGSENSYIALDINSCRLILFNDCSRNTQGKITEEIIIEELKFHTNACLKILNKLEDDL